MAIRTKTKGENTIHIVELHTERVGVAVMGIRPLIFNAMSQKAKGSLLLPPKKMNATEKDANLKHDPLAEYRSSVYAHENDDHPTRLMFPAAAFKSAARSAALRIPGVKKTEIGQLMWVEGDYVDIYGVPQMLISVTRSADAARTPDIRTRAILADWCCTISVRYVTPNLNQQQIASLLASAGLLMGIGDWRQEKGAGNYGQFEIVNSSDPKFQTITKTGIRDVQDDALRDPSAYDLETGRMLAWFQEESVRRGKVIPSARATNGNAEAR